MTYKKGKPKFCKETGQEESVLFSLLRQLRPKQWTKNLLVFAALLFSIKMATLTMVIQGVLGFILFCAVSSVVYILNDYADIEADRMHPEKCKRPMASGALNPSWTLLFGGILLMASLILSWLTEPSFFLVLVLYFFLNVAYTFKLKHIVIADVMVIALGFVIRAAGGALITGLVLTPWFLFCTLLLALFLAISKRRHEVALLAREGGSHRRVLDDYSTELLNQMISVVTTGVIMSYSLFTFTSGHTVYLMGTIPFVIYGVFRYLYLIHQEGKGGTPEKVLLEDRHILCTVVSYCVVVFVILKWFE